MTFNNLFVLNQIMSKKLILAIIVAYLLSCFPDVSGFQNFVRKSKFQKYNSINSVYGRINTYEAETPAGCLRKCQTQSDCQGAMLRKGSGEVTECQYITSGGNFYPTTGYDYFYYERGPSGNIANYDFLVEAGLPHPRLYFPLDVSSGTAMGSNPENVQFVNGEKVGGALLNSVNATSR